MTVVGVHIWVAKRAHLCFWLRVAPVVHDLGFSHGQGPTRIYSDSKSCVDLSYDPVSFKKTKHILRAAEGLRDYVARDVLTLVLVTGNTNLADILTKAQAVAVFTALMVAYDAFVSAA